MYCIKLHLWHYGYILTVLIFCLAICLIIYGLLATRGELISVVYLGRFDLVIEAKEVGPETSHGQTPVVELACVARQREVSFMKRTATAWVLTSLQQCPGIEVSVSRWLTYTCIDSPINNTPRVLLQTFSNHRTFFEQSYDLYDLSVWYLNYPERCLK